MKRVALLCCAGMIVSIALSLTTMASPGPDAEAETQTYEVELLRFRQSSSIVGELIFEGDPERPLDFESGALRATFDDIADEEVGSEEAGTWWSYCFSERFALWLVVVESETDLSAIAFGAAIDQDLWGRAFLLDVLGVDPGRYLLIGSVVESDEQEETPEEEVVEEIEEQADEEEESAAPEDSET